MGCGYVFSSQYIDFDKAYNEISKKIKRKIKVQREIKFNTGRLEKFWCKNNDVGEFSFFYYQIIFFQHLRI